MHLVREGVTTSSSTVVAVVSDPAPLGRWQASAYTWYSRLWKAISPAPSGGPAQVSAGPPQHRPGSQSGAAIVTVIDTPPSVPIR